MANRNFYPSQSYGSSRVYAEFLLLGNGTSAPTLASVDGADIVSTITRSSAGIYVITLKDTFNKVVFAGAEMDDTAADGNYATVGNIANEGTSTPIALTMNIRSGVNPSGSVALVSGTKTVANALVLANSTIFLTRAAQGGTVTSTVQYEAPAASIVANTSFVINACVAAGTTNAADTSTINWQIQNPTSVDAAVGRKIRVTLALRNGNWGVK